MGLVISFNPLFGLMTYSKVVPVIGVTNTKRKGNNMRSLVIIVAIGLGIIGGIDSMIGYGKLTQRANVLDAKLVNANEYQNWLNWLHDRIERNRVNKIKGVNRHDRSTAASEW